MLNLFSDKKNINRIVEVNLSISKENSVEKKQANYDKNTNFTEKLSNYNEIYLFFNKKSYTILDEETIKNLCKNVTFH